MYFAFVKRLPDAMHVLDICVQIIQYHVVHDVCVHIYSDQYNTCTWCFCKNWLILKKKLLHDVCAKNFLDIETLYQNDAFGTMSPYPENSCTWRLCSEWPIPYMFLTFVYKPSNIIHVHDVRNYVTELSNVMHA